MDEKELTKKIRNSLKANKTRAQITSSLQEKGYKLAYIDRLLSKAMIPKKFLMFGFIFLISCFLFASLIYIYEKKDFSVYENPLQGFTIVESLEDSYNNLSNNGDYVKSKIIEENNTIPKDEIEIDEKFVNFLLKTLGADSLHKSPLTFESPIINIVVEGKEFNSIIGKEIATTQGKNKNADLEIITTDKTILRVFTAENSQEKIFESFNNGESSIEILVSEAELLSKGYLSLYNHLNF